MTTGGAVRRGFLAIAACTVMWAGAASAAPTAQQKCNDARVTAWRKYVSCIDVVLARDAKGTIFDEFAAFAKCRHKYFGRWVKFQTTASLAGSSCTGVRFTDNGATVTDNLSGLVWEKKSGLDTVPNFLVPSDADNSYTWSTGSNTENGTVFTSFLDGLNGGGGFDGANGWRLPNLVELQTLVLDFECNGMSCVCPTFPAPCVDPGLDAANTTGDGHWSATSYVPTPSAAWIVGFNGGGVFAFGETISFYARAVRGGL